MTAVAACAVARHGLIRPRTVATAQIHMMMATARTLTVRVAVAEPEPEWSMRPVLCDPGSGRGGARTPSYRVQGLAEVERGWMAAMAARQWYAQ